MSGKDYRIIADALCKASSIIQNAEPGSGFTKDVAFNTVVIVLANMLASDNNRFDRRTFMSAVYKGDT